MENDNIKSNINMYYEATIEDIAERAIEDIEDGTEESEAIINAIDEGGLMYYTDQAYLLAHALTNGTIKWGEEVNWNAVFEDVYTDVAEEISYKKEHKEEKGE